jgi:hypothetical protein
MTDPTLTTDPDYRLEYIVEPESWTAQRFRNLTLPGRREPLGIHIRKAHRDGSSDWEFTIVDTSAQVGTPGLELRIHDDAFPALTEIPSLFTALGQDQPFSLGFVRRILDRLGFVDATVRTDPVAHTIAETLRAKAAELLAEADQIDGGTP